MRGLVQCWVSVASAWVLGRTGGTKLTVNDARRQQCYHGERDNAPGVCGRLLTATVTAAAVAVRATVSSEMTHEATTFSRPSLSAALGLRSARVSPMQLLTQLREKITDLGYGPSYGG